jgi:iron complex transport system substrate-binding protein
LFRSEAPMKNRFNRLGTIFLILAVSIGLLASCASPPQSKLPAPTEITDQLGRVVTLGKTPQRIISLAPSNTEILFALGLADRMVAITDYCNYPPEAEAKPTIGGFNTPNIEAIVGLSPDLIMATSIHETKVIPQLEDKGLTVLALNPKTIDDVLEAILLVGRVTGVEANAAKLVDGMRQRLEAVTGRTAQLTTEQRPRTFYIVWHDPLKTAGSRTLQDELIQKAGGINIAHELTDYANISLEVVVRENPEVIIAGVGHGSGQDQTFRYAQAESRLRDMDARRNNRVYAIDSDLTSRPGPRIADALEHFAIFIHPELFK